ncbi:molybdate ABC transporter substrate-binding protein [Mycolicibacter sinensis]|uniref:Molybdate-binding protein ModA n=1 Tax=Mycolicibacter sinensis (strain JDM601) TaxID=875328 RepID=A0A1A2E7Q1_MYCSD|nr:molybdate ABC transporter substrate-binding protein [Mycolicibacter sinensis]OBF95826.1 molybdate ABC transporter substrate-binding protein [Mycolicibacter sinensis]OBG01608.1 molybdate ABC transporter substrate-binding protein [Mycolicibacter sinensis]
MWRTRALSGAVAVMLGAGLTGLTGCSSGPATPSITVFAAASLRPAFTEIAEQFKTDHPGVAVEFNFAGSSDLATQLTQGARADVFASANTAQMDKVAQPGLLDGEAVPFATNTLVIVTAPGNPHAVRSFADLAAPGLAVVVCQPPVPCGAATRKVEDATGVRVNPVSEEPDVTDVLNKVTTGQADAGVVYRTDAINAGDRVVTVAFPEAAGAVNTYPVGVLKDAAQPGPAKQFVDLVTGAAGQKILHAAGFGKP